MQIRHISGAVLYDGKHETVKDAAEAAVRDGANLDGAYLRGANLDGANLDGANLDGANLDGANLDGAYLRGAYLRGANLRGANLDGAYLGGAYLRGAYLRGANLDGANLDGANLDGANLDGAYLDGAYLGDPEWTLVGSRPILQVGPIGSRADWAILWLTSRGAYVRAGCFFGPLADFSVRVNETHGDGPHGVEYRACTALFEAHAGLWGAK